jgi:ABC-2 type transport system ATP-binding protein
MNVQLRRMSAALEPLPRLPTPVAPPPRLRLSGICKTWSRRPILDSVDLALERGMLVALVGANGVGKTTLLRIVAGLIAPDSGTVRLDGIDVSAERREYQQSLGFLSAGQTGLYARLSVREQLEYWARIAFVPRPQRADAVGRAIERFALGDLCGQRVERLSMGQRQRVRLAMTFLHEPRLLLLDEPRTSLDPAGVDALSEVLSEFVSLGGTAIWCAPVAEDVSLPTARVYTLSEARVIAA